MALQTVFIFLVFCVYINGDDITDVMRPVNCDNEDISDNTSCGQTAPYANTDDIGTSYPDDGFCIVLNNTHVAGPGVIGYEFNMPVCSANGDFGGGIFFNYQDELNYDVFYLVREDSRECTLGYVENGIVHNITSYNCKPVTDSLGWYQFEVEVLNGSVQTSIKFGYPLGVSGESHQYEPHFGMSPVAGPLHINADGYHAHLHFLPSTLNTVTCQDSPELCDTCSFAYNIQTQPVYPLPDYRNFLLWYARALEMVYTSCYIKMRLELDEKSALNATSYVGTFSDQSYITPGDIYGERHACITNSTACVQVKAAGMITDGETVNEDRTLINIKPYDKSKVTDIEINPALQLIYGDSIQKSEPKEFAMLLDALVYGPDFGIYCYTSKSVYDAETVSENMCLNGSNDGSGPPQGGIVQHGWAVRFY